MRRRLALILTLALCALSPAAVCAQPFSYGIYAQGVLQYSTASVSAVNTASPVALWSAAIPGALTATTPNTNWSPSSVQTPPPMHLTLFGTLSTNVGVGAVGTINVGVNYGGGVTGVASVALANAWIPESGLRSAPLQIDVWISPVATATNTSLPGGGACWVFVKSRMAYTGSSATAGTSAATDTVFNANTCGTTGGAFLASAEQLNVLWQWASASNTNAANIYSGNLKLGL